MIVLSAETVQAVFVQLGLPFRFDDRELGPTNTTKLVSTREGLLAFPTPKRNTGLNILNLRSLLGVDPKRQPAFFDHPWYLDEEFGGVDCPPGWHFIQTEVDRASLNCSHNYYDSDKDWELPLAVEVILMLFLHYVVAGEQLLLKKHTWCKDRASLDRFVTVGAFGRNGVFVSGHPQGYFSRGLGVCGKLRRQPPDLLSH